MATTRKAAKKSVRKSAKRTTKARSKGRTTKASKAGKSAKATKRTKSSKRTQATKAARAKAAKGNARPKRKKTVGAKVKRTVTRTVEAAEVKLSSLTHSAGQMAGRIRDAVSGAGSAVRSGVEGLADRALS